MVRLSGGKNGVGLGVAALLKANPQQADRVKTALISALEKQGAEHDRSVKEGQGMSEGFLNFWVDLAEAVAALQDPRAAKGLLMAVMSHAPSAVEGLADICPAIVDSIIARAHEPEMYFLGASLGVRTQAIGVLGNCLRRPGASFSPDAASKIRRELMTAADDPDSGVRALAVFALMPLRAEPEVQAKLRTLAATDPYVSLADGTRDGASRFSVREAAARALDPPDRKSTRLNSSH